MTPETTYTAVLGRVIREKRKAKDWDQAQAAEECGVNRSSWSRIESGEIALDVVQLNKIANGFGLSVDEFLKEVTKAQNFLTNQGVRVHQERKKPESNKIGLFVLGTALGALVAIALADKGKK